MIYINNIIPEKEILDNQFLKNLRKTQEKYIDKVKARFFDKIILEVPKVDSEVVGLNALEALSEIIYKNLSLDVIIGVSGKFRRG
jgi:arsenite-transporting ATPase